VTPLVRASREAAHGLLRGCRRVGESAIGPIAFQREDELQQAERVLEGSPVSISVIEGEALSEGGFGGTCGVGRGSPNTPRLLELRYGSAQRPDITLVGKGITFDSGGLSLKSPDALMSMKNDVSGAAAVLAAMTLVHLVAPSLTVHALAALAENMPDGGAMRPGEVIRLRNGATIEVLNTDFEGRLVLADGIAYASEAAPLRIVDIASLTYAAANALGTDMAALLGNDDSLLFDIEQSASASGEDVWRRFYGSTLSAFAHILPSSEKRACESRASPTASRSSSNRSA
jgi:leucyl aminopeptidase